MKILKRTGAAVTAFALSVCLAACDSDSRTKEGGEITTAAPDIIITNAAYEGYDCNEIKSRAGWENIKAVKNGTVYRVDPNVTNRPSQHIAEGIYETAKAIHPEVPGIAE